MHDTVPEIAGLIAELFREKSLRLSVAESCTGGLISLLLTTQPGASEFFDTGVVCYSVTSKRRMLGVSEEVICQLGVISEETAREMSREVLSLSDSDYALAITGNLGPEAMEDKPVGLVYIAVSSHDQTSSIALMIEGEREEIRREAAEVALKLLYDYVREWA